MGANTGEIRIGSERELYDEYIRRDNKASTIIILIQMHIRLLIGVPCYSSSEVIEKNKICCSSLLLFHRGVSVNHRRCGRLIRLALEVDIH